MFIYRGNIAEKTRNKKTRNNKKAYVWKYMLSLPLLTNCHSNTLTSQPSENRLFRGKVQPASKIRKIFFHNILLYKLLLILWSSFLSSFPFSQKSAVSQFLSFQANKDSGRRVWAKNRIGLWFFFHRREYAEHGIEKLAHKRHSHNPI